MTNEKRDVAMGLLEPDEETGSECSSNRKRKLDASAKNKRKKSRKLTNNLELDIAEDIDAHYCWICHCQDSTLRCMFCPRVYHPNCIDGQTFDFTNATSVQPLLNCSSPLNTSSSSTTMPSTNNISTKNQNAIMREFSCPECVLSMLGDCNQHGRLNMQVLLQDDLREMMMYIVLRLYHYNGALHFQNDVDDKSYRDYNKYIKHPMNLKLLKKKIDEGCYNSMQQFTSDFKWIYHNCVVYNGDNYITSCARNLISLGLKEIHFVESCPQCFQIRLPFMVKWLKDLEHSYSSGTNTSSGVGGLMGPKTKTNWRFSFDNRPIQKMWITELCDTIHPIVWVRLQGYPTWPGKLISIDDDTALILFFGDYDLNTVPLGSMYMHTQSCTKQLNLSITSGQSEDGGKKNKSFSNALANNKSNGDNMDSSTEVMKEYRLAMDQMNLHIENIKQRYPGFIIPPKKYETNITRGIEHYKKFIRRKQRQTENVCNTSNSNCNNSYNNQKSGKVLNNSNSNTNDANVKCVQPKLEHVVDNSPMFTTSNGDTNVHPDRFIENFTTGFTQLMERFKMEYKEVMDVYTGGKDIKMQQQLNNKQESFNSKSNINLCEMPKPTQNTNDIVDIDSEGVTDNQNIPQENIPKIEEQIAIIEKEPDQDKIELIKYIRYLEEKLLLSDSEIKRQELLGSLRFEELSLETCVQQKEARKVLENDFKNTMIQASQKFKKNEWCAYCGKTALFFCCWNTCYCNSECQINHWMVHKSHCAQMAKKTTSNSNTTSSPANNNTSPVVSAVPVTTVTVAPSNRTSSITTSNVQPGHQNTHTNMNTISYHQQTQQQQQQQQHMIPYQNAQSILPNNIPNSTNSSNTIYQQHRNMMNGNLPINSTNNNPNNTNNINNNNNNGNSSINNGVIVGPITNTNSNSNILTNSLLSAINHRNIVGAQMHHQQLQTQQQPVQPQLPVIGPHNFIQTYNQNRTIR